MKPLSDPSKTVGFAVKTLNCDVSENLARTEFRFSEKLLKVDHIPCSQEVCPRSYSPCCGKVMRVKSQSWLLTQQQ